MLLAGYTLLKAECRSCGGGFKTFDKYQNRCPECVKRKRQSKAVKLLDLVDSVLALEE